MRRYLTTTAALTALLIGCGKDEPAAPPTPPQPAAATTPPPAPAPEAKPEGGAGETDKKKEDEAGRSAAPAPEPLAAMAVAGTPPARPALTPTTVATIPADLVAVGGTPSLKALVTAFSAQVAQVPGASVPADPLAMALGALQSQTGLDLGWMDTDKPLRFAVPDPKKSPEGFVLLVPVKDGVTVDEKTFAQATPGKGHFVTVKVGGRDVFVDKGPAGHLLVTSHDGLAKELEAFTKDLAAWTPTDPLTLDASVENLVRVYGDELKGIKDMVTQMAGAMAQNPESAGKIAPALQAAAGGFALIEGMARAGISIDPVGDYPRVALSFKGLPGSPAEKWAKTLEGHKIGLAGAVPADAWLAIAYDVPGSGMFSDAKEVVEAITRSSVMGPLALTWTDDEKAKVLAILTRVNELQGSQAAMWVREDNGHPFVFEGVAQVKDGVAMRGAIGELGDLFYTKVWGEGRKMMLAQGAPEAQLPVQMQFKDFVGMFSAQTTRMGVQLALNESATRAGNKLDSLEVKIDWAKLPLRGEIAKVGELVGPDIGVALAGEGTSFASVIGPNAGKRAATVLDNVAALAEPTDPWLALSKDEAIFAALRPARLMRALIDVVPSFAERRALIAQLSDDPIVVRGHSDGTTLTVEGVVPAKFLLALAQMQ